MATFSTAITQSADDAREAGNTTVSITNAYVWTFSNDDHIGLRFQNVTIPIGSTINSAAITVYFSTTDQDSPDLLIYGEDADNAAQFAASNGNISGRTKTTASVAWQDTDLGIGQHASPDISTVIQEIIDRPGWSSGNAIALILEGQTTNFNFTVAAYDGSDPEAEIDIDYSPPGGANRKTGRVRLTTKVGGILS